ncbi:DUF1549 domain-containing protein [Caulifigura coniformis]|uniref:DUF1549 domain-containing protein n=1 Tax=Caulifigura coniformis TaxID=2527983 RepID=UPI0018D21388|nr:DUF1549 domain-containing protein [Caulifigura coniformis]
MKPELRDRLFPLLEALCEERLNEGEAAQLEALILSNADARRMFVEYLSLHGLLYWDAVPDAGSVDIESIIPSAARPRVAEPSVVGPSVGGMTDSGPLAGMKPRRLSAAVRAGLSTVAALLVLAAAFFVSRGGNPPAPAEKDLVQETPRKSTVDETPLPKIELPSRRQEDTRPAGEAVATATPDTTLPETDADVVATLDRLLETSWSEGGVSPSAVAEDGEWLRRVSLDLCGRIPELTEIEQFTADQSPNKRARVVDRLLNDPAYARHFGTVWTNLLVGRSPKRQIDREGLSKFLREQFWNGRPWSETVTELVSAEGSAQENGAANYLLAHLNNQAVPATAITARLFLCQQVQCAQCHIHPIVKDWGQEQFWQLNAFFQGTKLVEKTRQLDDGRRITTKELVNQPAAGPIYFETLNGVMRVAYPTFDGKEIPPAESTHRRNELAKLMSEGDRPQLAAAFVNRLWAQLFGRGFTTPLDDMGPHNPPTHPEVLELLTREFVKSDYDVRQLLRWMCASKLYQLSSRATAENEVDDPENGSLPMFTRMYVKPLSAEQLFDSLLVATNADRTAAMAGDAEKRRETWLGQFYTALDNDENTEQTTFDGSLPQALVMMNGDLVKEAVSGRPGTFLSKVEASPLSDGEKLERLSMAILARKPTPIEQRVFEESARGGSRGARVAASGTQSTERLQDACWAYLNSTEFVVNR